MRSRVTLGTKLPKYRDFFGTINKTTITLEYILSKLYKACRMYLLIKILEAKNDNWHS